MKGENNNRGAVLVEFAIVLPIFILILIGTVEFGIVLHDYSLLQSASREGARAAAVGFTQAAIEQRVRDFALDINNENLTIEINNAQGVRGSTVSVRTSYPVPLITPLMQSIVGSSSFNLRAETLMRLE